MLPKEEDATPVEILESEKEEEIKVTAEKAKLQKTPVTPVKQFDESKTIGLKLVDLGLGDEFDGKKGKEKGSV